MNQIEEIQKKLNRPNPLVTRIELLSELGVALYHATKYSQSIDAL